MSQGERKRGRRTRGRHGFLSEQNDRRSKAAKLVVLRMRKIFTCRRVICGSELLCRTFIDSQTNGRRTGAAKISAA